MMLSKFKKMEDDISDIEDRNLISSLSGDMSGCDLISDSEDESGSNAGIGNKPNKPDSRPMLPANKRKELVENQVGSFASGWSLFTSSVSKAARTASASAVKYGSIASQKICQMATSVSEKVGGAWGGQGGSDEARRASNSSGATQRRHSTKGYSAMTRYTSDPYSQWVEHIRMQKESSKTRNLCTNDLFKASVSSATLDELNIPVKRAKKED